MLDTANFPPVQANSGSEKAISDQIIDALLTEKMRADQRPLLTVSDPEPSHLHQKLTNKRLYKDESDPIRNIVNIPGRMHIEMHLLTSISTYQPHLFIISYFITQMFGYKRDLMSTSLSKERDKMVDELNVYVIDMDEEDESKECFEGWTGEFIEEVRTLDVLDVSSFPTLLRFFHIWKKIPAKDRQLKGTRRTFMNLPEFSQLRHYLRAMWEGWKGLDDDLRLEENQLNEFFKELDFFMTPITDAQCGSSATFFSRFGTMIALFKLSNRPRLVQVLFIMFLLTNL